LQELLGPLDATQDDVLVRRQTGGRLELPREVVGVEADDTFGPLTACQDKRRTSQAG
jgi:hypothetical protein